MWELAVEFLSEWASESILRTSGAARARSPEQREARLQAEREVLERVSERIRFFAEAQLESLEGAPEPTAVAVDAAGQGWAGSAGRR